MALKRTLSLVLCAVLLLGVAIYPRTNIAINASAADTAEEVVVLSEKDFTYLTLPKANPTYAVITKYTGSHTKIQIPETLEGYPVKRITGAVFSDCPNLTYVKLPATVIGVGENVFNGALSLTEIDVAEGNAYYTAEDGVLYGKDTNEASPTYGEITTLVRFPAGKGGSFTAPKSITSISNYAFYYCYHLTEVKMYNNVSAIGDFAFSYCWNLSYIKLSDNLRSLGMQALSYCPKLKQLTLPATLQVIGTDAILGFIDSETKSSKVYYLSQGIICTPNTYAYDYVLAQHLPESIIIKSRRTVTDIDTGIILVDANDILPVDKNIDISVENVEISEMEELFPIRYNEAFVLDISITSDGESYSPDGKFVFNFDSFVPDAIPSASKVYIENDNRLFCVNGSPNTPFVGCQVKEDGRFVILTNNDFSLKGDIDGDNVVSLYDAKAALHAAIGTLTLTEEQLATANADDSESTEITVEDARNILRRAAGIIK